MTQDTVNGFHEFVVRYLVTEDAKCYRHCQSSAKFNSIFQRDSTLAGAYACPENYVSRVVYFADRPDPAWFEKFLGEQVGDRLHKTDIRSATRHGWELGGSAEDEIRKVSTSGSVKEYYWTFYPKSEEDKKYGTFLCSKNEGGCGRLFNKLLSDSSKLCPKCS